MWIMVDAIHIKENFRTTRKMVISPVEVVAYYCSKKWCEWIKSPYLLYKHFLVFIISFPQLLSGFGKLIHGKRRENDIIRDSNDRANNINQFYCYHFHRHQLSVQIFKRCNCVQRFL